MLAKRPFGRVRFVFAAYRQQNSALFKLFRPALKRIERSGYDVFTARARVPKPRQALIALRQWLWS